MRWSTNVSLSLKRSYLKRRFAVWSVSRWDEAVELCSYDRRLLCTPFICCSDNSSISGREDTVIGSLCDFEILQYHKSLKSLIIYSRTYWEDHKGIHYSRGIREKVVVCSSHLFLTPGRSFSLLFQKRVNFYNFKHWKIYLPYSFSQSLILYFKSTVLNEEKEFVFWSELERSFPEWQYSAGKHLNFPTRVPFFLGHDC